MARKRLRSDDFKSALGSSYSLSTNSDIAGLLPRCDDCLYISLFDHDSNLVEVKPTGDVVANKAAGILPPKPEPGEEVQI